MKISKLIKHRTRNAHVQPCAGRGARGLRAMMESLLMPVMFDLPTDTGLDTCDVVLEKAEESETLKVNKAYDEDKAAAVVEEVKDEKKEERPNLTVTV